MIEFLIFYKLEPYFDSILWLNRYKFFDGKIWNFLKKISMNLAEKKVLDDILFKGQCEYMITF